jgi:hypothetical protein
MTTMSYVRRRSTAAACLLALLAASALRPGVHAQPAPITGEYTLRHAQPAGDTVMVHLALRLTNETGGHIAGARLSVRDSVDASVVYGVVDNVSLPIRAPHRVAGTFTVAAAEFERWQGPGRPSVAVEYRARDGQVQAQWIALIPGDVQ